MQRIPQNMTTPTRRQSVNDQQGRNGTQTFNQTSTFAENSPAFTMAKRIRNEQGTQRAKQYLLAMEPYLAPAERSYIAQQLNITLSDTDRAEFEAKKYAQAPPQSQYQPPVQAQYPPSGNQFGQGGIPFNMSTQNGGGAGNIMQMMQMLGMMQNMGGMGKGLFGGQGQAGGKGTNDQMMLMQQLLGMMGKK